MAESVTLVLGNPTQHSATATVIGWIQWDNRAAPVGLGDISVLSADSFGRSLTRLRLFYSGVVQLQTVRESRGQSGFRDREELLQRWKSSPMAITLSGAGLTTLQIKGPDASGTLTQDSTEPYSWNPGQRAAIRTFINEMAAGSSATTSYDISTTIVLEAVEAPVTVTEYAVGVGDANWSFSINEPAVTHIEARAAAVDHAVNAGPANWNFVVGDVLVTSVKATKHEVDAGHANWSFSIGKVLVTSTGTVDYEVDASRVNWSFAIGQVAVTSVKASAHEVDASRANWSFMIGKALVTHTKPGLVTLTVSTRLRPTPSNNRYAYQASPNRAVPQLATYPDIFMSIPGKRASLGELVFPFSGLIIDSSVPISSARWRRNRRNILGNWTDIILGRFTDIVSAIRFYSEILNEYGEFIYDLDVVLQGAPSTSGAPIIHRVSVSIQSKILLGLPKTTDVNGRYRPFSDAHIAIDKTKIGAIKHSVRGDETIAKRVIKRPVLYSGEHDGPNNSAGLVNSAMDFTGLNIRLGEDILRNVTGGGANVITGVTSTTIAVRGNLGWDNGDDYEILDGASLDIIARGFELSHSASGLYILTLHVEDLVNPPNESSASVFVSVDEL